MKKIQFLALGAIAFFIVSCNNGSKVSTNVNLNTAKDTLAYAWGSQLIQNGILQYLNQMEVVKDTALFRMMENGRIQAEPDSMKRMEMTRKLNSRIDSLNKANKKNMDEFIKGLQTAIKTGDDNPAYARGMEMGGQLGQFGNNLSKHVFGPESDEKINMDIVLAALVNGLKGGKSIIENPGEVFEGKMQQIQDEKMKEEYGANIEAGEKFLAENKGKEGVVTLPSGLQYKIIKEGNGPKPTANDIVRVNYHGTLIDGTVFDSTKDREPTTFNVSGVIKGWTEALQLMPVGSTWMLYVPTDLAYGSRNQQSIKPFSTLIFEVELLGIEKK